MKKCLKKLFVAVFLVGAISISGCGADKLVDNQDKAGKSMDISERGLKVAELVQEKIQNKNLIEIYLGAGQLYEKYTELSNNMNYGSPKMIYEATFDKDSLDYMLLMAGIKDKSSVSDEVWDELRNKCFGNCVNTYIAGKVGAEALALQSVFATEYYFVDSSIANQNFMYIYVYENAYPIIVSFCPGDDGAVKAAGNVVLVDDQNLNSEEDVKGFLTECNLMNANVKKIQ